MQEWLWLRLVLIPLMLGGLFAIAWVAGLPARRRKRNRQRAALPRVADNCQAPHAAGA